MIALVYFAGLFTGAFSGVLFMAIVATGHREDNCRSCWRQEPDHTACECDSFGGTDD